MTRSLLAATVVAALLATGPGGGALASSGDRRRADVAAQARQVVATFFRTLNARTYDRTCALLADAYFEQRPGSERRTCAIGLRTALMWTQEIRWRVTAVRRELRRVLVDTIADGAPTVVTVTSRSRC